METSVLFRASEITGIKATSIFAVSDNTVRNKSLYSGRSIKDKEAKGFSRYHVTSEIVMEILKKLS